MPMTDAQAEALKKKLAANGWDIPGISSPTSLPADYGPTGATRPLAPGMAQAQRADRADYAESVGLPRPAVVPPAQVKKLETVEEKQAWNKEVRQAGGVGNAQLARIRAGLPMLVEKTDEDRRQENKAYIKEHGSPAGLTGPAKGPPVIQEGSAPDAPTEKRPDAPDAPGQSHFSNGYIPPMGGGGPSKAQKTLFEALQSASERKQENYAEQEGRGNEAIEANDEMSKVVPLADAVYRGEVAQNHDRELELRDKVIADVKAGHERMMAKMDALKKIDPENWWNTRSAGQKVLMAISVAMGAFAGSMPGGGGKNHPLDIMNNAIENDMKAQKTNLDSEWAKISKGIEFEDKKFARGQWELSQLSHDRVFALEKFKQTVAIYQQRAQTAEQKVKLGALIQAAKEAQINEQIGQAQRQYQFATMGQGGGMAAIYQQALKILAKATEEREAARAKGETPGPAPNLDDIVNHLQGRGPSNEGPAAAGGMVDPLAGIPKNREDLAKKELEEKAKHEEASAAIDRAAEGIKSLNVFENPGGRITSKIGPQSSEGAKSKMAIDAFNSSMLGFVHKANPAARGLEAMEAIAGPYLIKPGDTKETIDAKIARAKRDFAGPAATPILDSYKKTPTKQVTVPGATLR